MIPNELAQLIYGGLTGATIATLAATCGRIRQALRQRRQDELAAGDGDGWITVEALRAHAAPMTPAESPDSRRRAVLLGSTKQGALR